MSSSVRLYVQLIGRLKQLFMTLLYVSCSAATSSGLSNYHGSEEGRITKSNSPYRVVIRDERSSTGLYFRKRLFVNTLVNVVKVDNLHYVMQVTEVTEVIW